MDDENFENHQNEYTRRVADLEAVLWSEAEGSYFDFNHVTKKPLREHYSSNFVPLYMKDYPEGVNAPERDRVVLRRMEKDGDHTFDTNIFNTKSF